MIVQIAMNIHISVPVHIYICICIYAHARATVDSGGFVLFSNIHSLFGCRMGLSRSQIWKLWVVLWASFEPVSQPKQGFPKSGGPFVYHVRSSSTLSGSSQSFRAG